MTAFRLTPSPVGPGRVEIDGEDITDRVAGVHIDAAIGQPTVMTVYVQAGGVVEGDGIIMVDHQPTGGDAEVIAGFLAAVDPDLLHEDALRSLGPGQTDLTAAMLDVLARMARGEV